MAPEALDELDSKLDPWGRSIFAMLRAENAELRISPIVNSHFGASGSLVSVIGIGAKRRGLVDELVGSL
jgi:hypothetical protein